MSTVSIPNKRSLNKILNSSRGEVPPGSLDNILARKVFITPGMAAELLQLNKNNYRKPDRRHISRLKDDMSHERWGISTDCIGIAVDGTLVNGQHRLEGVVESGAGQWFIVATGLPNDTQQAAYIDRGRRRNSAQDLANMGIANGSVIRPCVGMLWKVLRTGDFNKNVDRGSGQHTEITDEAFRQLVHSDPSFEEAVGMCKIKKSRAPVSAWYWLAKHDDLTLANDCRLILMKEKDASNHHPFSALREFLVSSAKGARLGEQYIRNSVAMACLFKAYGLAKTGSSVKSFKIPASGEVKVPQKCMTALQQAFSFLLQDSKAST